MASLGFKSTFTTRVSGTDTTPDDLISKFLVADEANTADILEIKLVNGGANEQLKIAIDESKLVVTASQISDFAAAVSAHSDVAANTAARHSHANKALLDTYTQTEVDLASAVALKHSHANKALLDTYTQTEVDLASAVALKHAHSNFALLETYTQTEVDLASAVSLKHSHANKALLDTYTQTEVDLASAVSLKHTQNSDTSLDFGQPNQVTALELRTHVDDSTIHFTQASISIISAQISDFTAAVGAHADVAANTAARHTQGTDLGLDTAGANPVTAATIVAHHANVSNPHSVTAAQVGAPALVNPSTDNGIVRFDGIAGLHQDSGVTIDDSDNMTIPGQLFLSAGSAAANALTFVGNPRTGIFQDATDTFSFMADARRAMQITASASGNYGNAALGGSASTNDSYPLIVSRTQSAATYLNVSNNSTNAAARTAVLVSNGIYDGQFGQFGVGPITTPAYYKRTYMEAGGSSEGNSIITKVAGKTTQIYSGGRTAASKVFEFHNTSNEAYYPIQLMTGTTTYAPLNFPTGATAKTTPVEGDMEYVDGHLLFMQKKQYAVAMAAAVKTSTTTVVNTATETQIYSYTFAADQLNTDQSIEFVMNGIVSNASGSDDYTIRFKVGGTTVHTISRSGGNVTDVGWDSIYTGTIRTSGASGTFVDYAKHTEGSLTYSVGESTGHSIDTTGTVLFEVTVEWGTAKAGNTFSCIQGRLLFLH